MKTKKNTKNNWQYWLGVTVGIPIALFSVYFAYWLVYITEYSIWDWHLSEIAHWGIRVFGVFAFTYIGVATVCYFLVTYLIKAAQAIQKRGKAKGG